MSYEYIAPIDYLVDNTEEGRLLAKQPPRWANLFTPDDFTLSGAPIDPNLIPDSPLKEYLETVEILDDANPRDHLKLARMTGESIVDPDFLAHYGDPEELTGHRKGLMVALSFHDFHEGITGDRINKTKEFKIEELRAMHYVQDGIEMYNSLSPNYLNACQEAFYILYRDPKIKEKYKITDKDLQLEGLRFSTDPLYQTLGQVYDDIHAVTFVMAMACNYRQSIQHRALMLDVMNNSGNIFAEMAKKSPFVKGLVTNFRKPITQAMLDRSNSEVQAILQSWGRKTNSV